ncbi:MAG: hypothetical protein ACXVCU_19145 [Bdellovibrio sp.]
MKNLLLLWCLFFGSISFGSSKYIGNWKGYCDALPSSQESHICSYKFNSNNSGTYICERFKDLRCSVPAVGHTELKFIYKEKSSTKKSDILELNFENGDFSEETYMVIVNGKILSIIELEAKKRGDKSSLKGASPPYNFVRE